MTTSTRRVIPIVWTVLFAVVLTLVVNGIWAGLLSANLAISPAIPWAVLIMALLLWGMWRYLGGAWWPHRTAATRQILLRAKPVTGPVFAWALVAGVLAIVALAGLWIVLFHVAGLSAIRSLPNSSKYPVSTVALALIMASLVGALGEEAGFRGYFQGVLERQVPAPVAILIVVLVMAPFHAQTQGFVWPTLLFYGCVDLMLSTMVYLTQSIVPSVAVHGLGLLTFFTLVWPGDALRQVVGGGTTTTWVWIHTAQVGIFGSLSLLAFVQLRKSARIGHPR